MHRKADPRPDHATPEMVPLVDLREQRDQEPVWKPRTRTLKLKTGIRAGLLGIDGTHN